MFFLHHFKYSYCCFISCLCFCFYSCFCSWMDYWWCMYVYYLLHASVVSCRPLVFTTTPLSSSSSHARLFPSRVVHLDYFNFNNFKEAWFILWVNYHQRLLSLMLFIVRQRHWLNQFTIFIIYTRSSHIRLSDTITDIAALLLSLLLLLLLPRQIPS